MGARKAPIRVDKKLRLSKGRTLEQRTHAERHIFGTFAGATAKASALRFHTDSQVFTIVIQGDSWATGKRLRQIEPQSETRYVPLAPDRPCLLFEVQCAGNP